MKTIIILILLLLTVGCDEKEELSPPINEPNKEELIEETEIEEIITEEYIDDNPITVGLYKNGKIVKTYNKKFHDKSDIDTFNVVFSNEENLGSTNLKKNWNKYYSKYENIDNYKIGFLLEFDTDEKHVENLILDPSAKYVAGPYVFVYLYDGIHQKDGAKYSHLEMKDIKDNTIYASIKLYMSSKTNKITSPINLTVFTYDGEEDFDEENHYRGNSKYTITIYNK